MAATEKITNVATTSPRAASMIQLAEERAKRQRAARDYVEREEVPVDMVKVRVTKIGAGKVSMGEHVAAFGDAHYEAGEFFEHPRELAEILEARGLVEIQD